MKTLRTTAIVLSRTEYGEADRIITFLTPDYGKLRLMARGVRKIKSKLAGGIELFSTSDITFIQGRGDIGTLVSTRLISHYGRIVNDITRVQLGYDFIKRLNKATEDEPEPEYYELLEQTFVALDAAIDMELIRTWFTAQLLRLSGHLPNLHIDTAGKPLAATESYTFDFEKVAFALKSNGQFTASHIKTLRLLFSHHQLAQLQTVQGLPELLPALQPLITGLQAAYLRS